MSTSELRLLPASMSFSSGNVSDNWRRFKQKIEFYYDALGVAKLSDKKKVGILMTALGDAGIEVFNTFDTVDDTCSYQEIIDAFDSYCNPKKNTVYERFLFSQLMQGSQSVETFIVSLKNQARKCEFADVEMDNLVRDRLVVGINNAEVRKQMLRDADLTLETATALAKIWAKSEVEAAEMAKCSTAATSDHPYSVNRIQNNRYERDRDARPTGDRKTCGNCGYEHYSDKCPAAERECNYCRKTGHFASVCRKKPSKNMPSTAAIATDSAETPSSASANTTDTPEPSVELLQLYTVKASRPQSSWFVSLRIRNVVVRCKVDSGAECNTLSLAEFRRIQPAPPLRATAAVLRPYGDGKLIVPQGEVELEVVVAQRQHLVKFFVVDFPRSAARPVDSILGLPTIELIGLVKKTFSVAPHDPATPSILAQFPTVFDGKLGRMPGHVKLSVKPTASPVAEKPRRFPFSLKDKLRDAIARLTNDGVIVRVEEPTEWVSNLTLVTKPNGSLRICLDPKHLNEALIIPKCEIPRTEDIFSELHDKRYFTVFDLKDGFWQVELDQTSSYLTTFNTPYGRFRWQRLVMGVSSAPEVFMNKMREVFGDLTGVYPYFDDLIVTGVDEADHDRNLEALLRRAQKVGVRFNASKIQYRQTTVNYLGFQVGHNCVKPLPKHVKAISEMPRPTDRNGILRLLGMIRYLARFIPDLSSNTEHLRELTRKNVDFVWRPEHETEFRSLKSAIQNATDLRFYSPSQPLYIQTDSSRSGVGCCLFQDRAPISYASRALSKTEERYAQIEKELLAVVFALERFHDYTYGRPVTVYSDHRPLVAIVKKSIAELTPRLQRLRLRLLRYNFSLVFQPGKELFVADTLSRAYLSDEEADESYMQLDVHCCANVVASPAKFAELVAATAADDDLQHLKVYLRGGWPKSARRLTPALAKFRTFANRLRCSKDLIFFDNRLVVPTSLVSSMLDSLHAGHLNVHKTKQLARNTLFWLNMATDIELYVASCDTCNKFKKNNVAETLHSFPCPTRPWQRLHSDILTFASLNFLVVYDSYSHWLELFSLRSKSMSEIIGHFKALFARFGIPDEIVSDNSPYNSSDWLAFADAWKFQPLFSSPRYPQSNGASEKAVSIAKGILQKNTQLHYSLLQYRNAPIPHIGYSPSQLLMGRCLRTRLPVTENTLYPTLVDRDRVHQRKMLQQTRQKYYYDRGARDLPPLQVGDEIYYKKDLADKEWKPGAVVAVGPTPRSYAVEDREQGGRYLRNRRFIRRPVRYRDS